MATRCSTAICDNQDFISTLPDEVLTHILSYLPTKSSVASCVLSKRWCRLWISVPNLDFTGCWSDCSVRQAEIVSFIDLFLRLNTVMSVRTIDLDYSKIGEIAPARVNGWIVALGERDAVRITLKWPEASVSSLRSSKDGSSQLFYSLPDKFYIQRNLVKLKLSDVVLKVPKCVKFPKLKMIVLEQTQLFDDDSLKNLLSGSPVLKSFCMNHVGDSNTLHICSSSLQIIDIRMPYNELECEFIFDTPNLTDLALTNLVDSIYNVINLSSLVRANLSIFEDGEILLKLLTKIAHVKQLGLSAFVMKRLPRAFLVTFPVFHNLNHLDVVILYKESWEVLSHLFQCTPNLTGFNLIIGKLGVANPCNWCDPSEVPQCFLSCLESVEITRIKEKEEDDEVLPMISYFLKNAMVLKKLKLSICCSVEDFLQDDKFRTTLMSLPKSSATCEVKFNCSSDDDSS